MTRGMRATVRCSHIGIGMQQDITGGALALPKAHPIRVKRRLKPSRVRNSGSGWARRLLRRR